jgi:nicotinamidase-related amidase
MALIKTLEEYETVYFAGEAMSHCVANTLKQAMQFPELAKKFVILTDCMSNVKGFEHIADDIYAEAKALGIKFVASTDITL